MKLTTNGRGSLILREVYEGIILATKEDNRLIVCMRDDTFEMCVFNGNTKATSDTWRVDMKTREIKRLGALPCSDAVDHAVKDAIIDGLRKELEDLGAEGENRLRCRYEDLQADYNVTVNDLSKQLEEAKANAVRVGEGVADSLLLEIKYKKLLKDYKKLLKDHESFKGAVVDAVKNGARSEDQQEPENFLVVGPDGGAVELPPVPGGFSYWGYGKLLVEAEGQQERADVCKVSESVWDAHWNGDSASSYYALRTDSVIHGKNVRVRRASQYASGL